MTLGTYSFGIGDRFGHQGKAQLAAIQKAKSEGVEITPVWNKSFREHEIISTEPDAVRREADEAVKTAGWNDSYFVDADHVGLKTIDHFIEASDFFTLDVADFIGQETDPHRIQEFIEQHASYVGTLNVPGRAEPLVITRPKIEQIAKKYLFAVEEAGRIYRHLSGRKKGSFVVEVSMDETEEPQTPVELLFILSAIAREGIPAQTIAPKFSGRFNKGVDYVGDVDRFEEEFRDDLSVIRYAVEHFNLPGNLKLSVHSGSDKFAIYGPIGKAIREFDAGLHLKTAGTTWLEEIIGLAEAGGDGLALAKDVYREAFGRFEELCKPYATVINIDQNQLPQPENVDGWSSGQFADALRHDQSVKAYNPHLRQLLHVGYKVAAQMGDRFLDALEHFEETISKQVTVNLLERHIQRLFFV